MRRNVPGNLRGPMWGYPALLPEGGPTRALYLTGPGQWQSGGAARVTSPFGPRTNPISHGAQFHKGIDLGVPVGTVVYAANDGKIIKLTLASPRGRPDRQGAAPRSGNALYLRDAGGWVFGYMHLSSFMVAAGMVVGKGQAIALSGDSGPTTGPHLHYAVWNPDGIAVDPVSLYPLGTFETG